MRLFTRRKIFLILALFLISCGSLTDSLICFQCSASKSDDSCVTDWAGMANESNRHNYGKDCSLVSTKNWTRCMIQSMADGGVYGFYQRDCHDGSYFPERLFSPLFLDLPANNETTCDLVNGEAVCYTPCDEDFCNGPQFILPWTLINCTEDEGCGARGIFLKNELIITEIIGLMLSLFVTCYILPSYN